MGDSICFHHLLKGIKVSSFLFLLCSVVMDDVSPAQAKEEHFIKFLIYDAGETLV